jgi:hypothetical protein
MLKSLSLAKVHFSIVQITWNLTKQDENFCGINNYDIIKVNIDLKSKLFGSYQTTYLQETQFCG